MEQQVQKGGLRKELAIRKKQLEIEIQVAIDRFVEDTGFSPDFEIITINLPDFAKPRKSYNITANISL